jgi:dUTP pyrophosphatase
MSHEKYLSRLVILMDRLCEIMRTQPDYIFVMDGQYAMLEDYLAVRPEQTEEIRAWMTEGRLKVGPWYTQPLETLISGEAMIRNLQHGIAETEKLAPAMKLSYEIDEFGHASQTPQILQGFGIPGAIAWRGLPKNSDSAVKWYATDGSAAVDLRAMTDESYTLAPGERHSFPTGLAISPETRGVVAIIAARSGLGIKHGINLSNGIGVIDSDYRGEIMVTLHNHGQRSQIVYPGERIAQLAIVPFLKAEFEEADELSDTVRGAGGFGSTGK